MSLTDQENWEFLSRQHEMFLEDPGYKIWLAEQELKQEKEWDITLQKDQDGHSSLL